MADPVAPQDLAADAAALKCAEKARAALEDRERTAKAARDAALARAAETEREALPKPSTTRSMPAFVTPSTALPVSAQPRSCTATRKPPLMMPPSPTTILPPPLSFNTRPQTF